MAGNGGKGKARGVARDSNVQTPGSERGSGATSSNQISRAGKTEGNPNLDGRRGNGEGTTGSVSRMNVGWMCANADGCGQMGTVATATGY